MTTEDEGKEKAVRMYKILATLLGLLGTGLLVCGILAVANKDEDDFGMPYFLGGFIVGILTLITSGICTCIFLKAPGANNELKKKELGCAIQGQYILSMLTIMGCFIGCVSAGIGGVSSSNRFDDEEDDSDGIKKTLAIVILVGCILGVFVTIFSISTVCTYSSYFGVVIQRGRRGRVVIMNTGGSTTMPTTFNNASTFQMNTQANNQQINQLEAQNRLLQQQLELQRQLQQQQQQQQTGYSSGFYPPPPPPAYGFNQTENSPAFPPPSYDDVK